MADAVLPTSTESIAKFGLVTAEGVQVLFGAAAGPQANPDVTAAAAAAATKAPEAATEAPEATAEAPEATAEAHESTAKAHEATAEAGQATDEAPEATAEAGHEARPKKRPRKASTDSYQQYRSSCTLAI